MNIIIYTDSRHGYGGGQKSTIITAFYLTNLGHTVKVLGTLPELEGYLQNSQKDIAKRKAHGKVGKMPDVILHHNILNIEKVYYTAKKYNLPVIVTLNNIITDVNALHLEQDDDFGKVILKPGILNSFYLSVAQKRIHSPKAKLLSVLFFPYRYARKQRRLSVLNKVAGIIVTSATLKRLLELNGIKRRIHICPQPIDDSMLSNKIPPKHGKNIPKTSRYINPDYKHHILYVGGGEPFKGIHVLLKAFKQLALQDTTFIQDTELIIAGELRKAHKINPKNYPNNIKFLGEISYSSLKKLYSEVDFLVFPSLWLEAFGRAWAEALCIGCPVLAFKNRGGPSDYLAHNLTAYLAETSYSSLKHGIKELLENHVLRKKLTRNGKAYARKYLIGSAVARKLEKIYKEVLADNKSKLNTYNLTK